MSWAPPIPFEHELVMWERQEIFHLLLGLEGSRPLADPAFDFLLDDLTPGQRSRITTHTTFEKLGWRPS